MQEAWPQRPLVLYSGDGLTAQQLADSAFQSFSISIKPDFTASHSCMRLRHVASFMSRIQSPPAVLRHAGGSRC